MTRVASVRTGTAARRGGALFAAAAVGLLACAAPSRQAPSAVTPAPDDANHALSESAPDAPAGGDSAHRTELERQTDDREERVAPAVAIARAKVDLEVAERELLTSAGDCAVACRALASMQRAAAHLCALARDEDERHRCEDAKREVLDARERVRSTCTSCAAGPSLDKNASPFGRP